MKLLHLGSTGAGNEAALALCRQVRRPSVKRDAVSYNAMLHAAAVAKAGGGLGAAGVVIIMLWRPARSTMSLLFLM